MNAVVISAAPTSLSKFTRPDAQRAWPRRRLFDRMDRARERRVIWVCGSAGSGKTTFVSSYIGVRKLTSLWYQSDPGDADVAGFFHYFSMAATRALSPATVSLPQFFPAQVSGVDAFARMFLRDLCAGLAALDVIVIDNHQDAAETLDGIIRIAASELPVGCNLIVLSRLPLPASLAGLRITRDMAVIEQPELDLDLDETRSLSLHLGSNVTPELIERWHVTTRGWVAGLVLLSETSSAAGAEAGVGDLKALLTDYFSTEIFSHLHPEERDTLLCTAFLPSVSAEDVVKLTGIENSGGLLERLCQRNYFTTKHDHSYQLHPLFRAFLLDEAQKRFDNDAIRSLRLRAAQLSLQSQGVDPAVELLTEAQAWKELIPLFLEHAPLLVAQGRLATLDRWLSSVPLELREKQPWLFFWSGVCRLPYDPAQARAAFEDALCRFDRSGDRIGFAAAWSKVMETTVQISQDLAYFDQPLSLIDSILAEERLRDLPPILRHDLLMNTFIALFMRSPDHPRLPELEQRVRQSLLSSSSPDAQIACCFHLNVYYGWSGMFQKVRALTDTLRTLMRGNALQPLTMQMTEVKAAMTHWLVDAEFDSGLRVMTEALRRSEETGVHVWDGHLIGHAVAAAISKGDLDTADSLLERMRALPNSRRIDAALCLGLAAWHAKACGDIGLARERITRALETCCALGLPYGIGLCNAGYAILMGHEDPGYESHIEQALAHAQQQQSTVIEYVALLAQIRKFLDLGRDPEAVTLITRLFAIGRENGVWNCYFWDGSLMSRVCVKALEAGIEVDYAISLIRRRALVPLDPGSAPAIWPWPLAIHTFGGFKVLCNGEVLTFEKKSPAKPLALLQTLIALGGVEVSERRLIDELWPEAEADSALRALDTTLSRLRKLLGDPGMLRLSNKRLSLNPASVWVDAVAFGRLLDRIAIASPASSRAICEQALALYRGPFLDDEDGPVIIAARERFARAAARAAEVLARGEAGVAGEARLWPAIER